MSVVSKESQISVVESASEHTVLFPISAELLRQVRACPNLIPTLISSVSPKPLNLAMTREGLRCTGDRKSFLIVEHVLKRLLNQDPEQTASIEEIVQSVIADALKRDLAFRLVGLMRPIKALTFAQLAFMEDLLAAEASLTLGVGPTGTGKTYMAIAAAINLLAKEEIKQIVLTRPHQLIEGEVMTASVRAEREIDEQFAVFSDILHDLIGHAELEKLIARHKLEIAPMGMMRGRTFNDAFILIDEAQNTTVAKMRMAVTRTGRRSRLCITGDPDQADMTHRSTNGLSHLISMIEETDIGRIHTFGRSQIVRSDTVAQLESLYAEQDPAYFVAVTDPQTT